MPENVFENGQLSFEIDNPDDDKVHIIMKSGESEILDLVTDLVVPISRLKQGPQIFFTKAIMSIATGIDAYKAQRAGDEYENGKTDLDYMVEQFDRLAPGSIKIEGPTAQFHKNIVLGQVEIDDIKKILSGEEKIETPEKVSQSGISIREDGKDKILEGIKKGDYAKFQKITQGQSDVPSGTVIAGELLNDLRTGNRIIVGFGDSPVNWSSDIIDIETTQNGKIRFHTESGAIYEMI